MKLPNKIFNPKPVKILSFVKCDMNKLNKTVGDYQNTQIKN